MRKVIMMGAVFALSIFVIAWVISCGGGGSGGFDGSFSIPVGDEGEVNLTAGQSLSMTFTVIIDVNDLGGPFGSLAMNLQDNIPGVAFSTLSSSAGVPGEAEPLADPAGSMSIFIASAEAAQACTDGVLQGVFDISMDASQITSVSPPAVEASQGGMDIVNMGYFLVCIVVEPQVSAVANLNQVDFEMTQCADDPEDLSGTWEGTYSCTGNCSNESGDITLWITQADGSSMASYMDSSGATYSGSVCGNRFSFRGGDTGYDESGTFIKSPGGPWASKTSKYMDDSGTCYGTCYDSLERTSP